MERVHQLESHLSPHAPPHRLHPDKSIPREVLIVGTGVFGLSCAYGLAQHPDYQQTKITVLDRSPFPAPDGSSVDSSRIVRADYEDVVYAKLMSETMPSWLGEWGEEGRFTQCGLAIFCSGTRTEEEESFVRGALDNVTNKLGLEIGTDITLIHDEASARQVMGTTGGFIGARGYCNWTSGWAHAEDGLRYMRKKIEALNRVHFHTAEVERLVFGPNDTVLGVELIDGSRLTADLTILATGAWTPKLLDLRGIASATGQVLAYIDISEEEEKRLSHKDQPVIICETDGLFVIPPRNRQLKVARHGYGYASYHTIPHPEKPRSAGENITVSLPRTKRDDPQLEIPAEGQAACRKFLQDCIPSLGDRPFTSTRLCWYTDTPSGDFLIDYHPRYQGLFVATGGSGHAYKFLPTLATRLVDVLQRRDRDALGKELRERWRWPETRASEDQIWTSDWRGDGRKGMVLEEELAQRG